MSKVTTQPAVLTESQCRTMLNGGDGVRAVLVDGVVVGLYARNKYGVTIGTFDPQALTADENPFVASRRDFTPHPAGRTPGRTVRELVADVANGVAWAGVA